jgi:hypothetical protein
MLLIAKHRNGELGEVPLTFVHQNTKVVNHGYSSQQANYIQNNYTPINTNKAVDSDEPPF